MARGEAAPGLLAHHPQLIPHQIIGQAPIRLNRSWIQCEEVVPLIAKPFVGGTVAINEMASGEIQDNEIIAAQVSGKTQGITDAVNARNQPLF
ncbi:hypothetical protein [Synechococcus sp. CCY 0621]|uniref:hypothetical protein n=1 Tax=Synechococcus sp. CCY 0621 TaxID=2815603 RepID=UPI001C215769|nr:hypothetical protein [Synechococcus sp. CCY 0621]